MTYRITEKDAKDIAKELAEALGKRFDDCYYRDKNGNFKAIVGCWKVNCNPIYGGCEIQEIPEGGGIINPYGGRLPPREFYHAVGYALTTVGLLKKEGRLK